ncbi:aldo/keto reductase [Cyclobacterium marinum]|uniref:Aldo/keto reductase n=1 Tax=Cyclobacterium marinum (strain ATCC 25205 / DSM 745 / LMG 13164 / NCIMB 1802) TaxID=880070 RepID=G0IW19_CYCMS|nr:aldo/keto reductase [Cyclobacterium marinum]AEL26239.1 aldo/keto reductase [Cyclobacterium marinum DSM 745]
MKYRKLGNTDLNLSAVTFGSFAIGGWLWGGTEQNAAVDAIKASYDLGVTSIDTAPIYGQGLSEDIVGHAIKDLPRDKVQILTKFGMRWDLEKGTLVFNSQDGNGNDIGIYKYAGKESIIKECEDSLKRLGTDYIDLYQLHWPDVTTPIEETMEAVAELIKQGKVRYAGVCNYNVAQMSEAEKYIDLASNQVPYSMVLRDIEKEIVPYSLENGKGILAYSPLERGLLTGKMKPGYKFGEGDQRATRAFYKDENLKRTNEFLDKIKPIADEKSITLAQLVILWTLEQPGISVTLVGARNAEQAIQNAKSTDASLTKEEVGIIDKHLNNLVLVP